MKIKVLLVAVCLVAGISATCAQNSQPGRVTVKGVPVLLSGALPAIGEQAPDFIGVNSSMNDISLGSFRGKKVILNIFPSLDTPTCAMSVRHFNQMAASLPNTVVLAISMDLPFAQKRFCSTEGIENVIPLSVFRNPEFAKAYGILQTEGNGRGLLARAVVVIDETGKIMYTQLVNEVSEEPDYQDVMDALK